MGRDRPHPGAAEGTLPRYQAVLAAAEGRIAADDAALLDLRQQVAFGQYPTVHPIAAQLDRVNALLAQHDGNMEQARKWFGSSLAILQTLYGPQQWRVLRARRELQSAAS